MARKQTLLYYEISKILTARILRTLVKDHERATYSLATLERMMADELTVILLRCLSGM